MSQRNDPWQSYRKVTAYTAPAEHLVLMLYDGAIKFLEKSLAGFDFTDPLDFNQTINNNLQRAQDIVHELNARLDMDRGGDVAGNFRRLYTYFYLRLHEANVNKKKSPIEEVIRHLRGLREAWSEMLRRGPVAEGETAGAPEESLRFA